MQCRNCGEEKPPAAFRKEPRLSAGYRLDKCNTCRNVQRRARYDPAVKKVENRRNSWKVRAWRYGMSEEALLEMLAEQGGNCAICEEEMRTPCVDHCHETGRVRGLLCHRCNNLLGAAGDSPERLQTAQQYLLCCPLVTERNSRMTA